MKLSNLLLAAVFAAAAFSAFAQGRREAPPLPYRYLGRMVESGKTIVLLARGEQVFSVLPGQAFGPEGGRWRVERVTDTEVVFTYLPLGTQRVLQL